MSTPAMVPQGPSATPRPSRPQRGGAGLSCPESRKRKAPIDHCHQVALLIQLGVRAPRTETRRRPKIIATRHGLRYMIMDSLPPAATTAMAATAATAVRDSPLRAGANSAASRWPAPPGRPPGRLSAAGGRGASDGWQGLRGRRSSRRSRRCQGRSGEDRILAYAGRSCADSGTCHDGDVAGQGPAEHLAQPIWRQPPDVNRRNLDRIPLEGLGSGLVRKSQDR